MARLQRTHTCGELREAHVGQTVILNGWVNTYRSYNDQIFVDLRDRYGLTQVVIEADHPELFKLGQEIRNEWVLSVRGKVRERLPNKHNPKLATGDTVPPGGAARLATALNPSGCSSPHATLS